MPVKKDGTVVIDDKEIKARTLDEFVEKLLKQSDLINESNKNSKLNKQEKKPNA